MYGMQKYLAHVSNSVVADKVCGVIFSLSESEITAGHGPV